MTFCRLRARFFQLRIPHARSSTALWCEPSARSRQWQIRLQVHQLQRSPAYTLAFHFPPPLLSLRSSHYVPLQWEVWESLPAGSSPFFLGGFGVDCHCFTRRSHPLYPQFNPISLYVIIFLPNPRSLMSCMEASELWRIRLSLCCLIGRGAEQRGKLKEAH